MIDPATEQQSVSSAVDISGRWMELCRDGAIDAVLVRPDGHVSWCSLGDPDGDTLKRAVAASLSGSIVHQN